MYTADTQTLVWDLPCWKGASQEISPRAPARDRHLAPSIVHPDHMASTEHAVAGLG